MRALLRSAPWLLLLLTASAQAQVVNDANRPDAARAVRDAASAYQRGRPVPTHANNNDLADFGRWATFSKGLPHDAVGEPNATQYDALLNALLSGSPTALEAVLLGGERRLVNPQAGFAFVLEGADPQALTLRPAPDFDSAEVSGEMTELYWMSLVRDVRFDQYSGNSTITNAINELNSLAHYRGAKNNSGLVAAATLFRAESSGAEQGPFVSQFLYKSIPFGGGPLATESDVNPPPATDGGVVEPTAHQPMEQRIWTRFAGDDRVTAYGEWLDIQNGAAPADPVDTLEDLDDTRRYIRNGRDLAEWVHFDYPLQASLNAALLMARQGDFLPNGRYDSDPKASPRAFDANNPYSAYAKQEPFVTFGNGDTQALTALVTTTSLRAQWFQKWQVHRRLRPEEYGGRVHNTLTNARVYPLPAQLLNSAVIPLVLARNAARNAERGLGGGTYLLPQTFPEGSPVHPAYASGHSTYMGAGITVLKAFYADFPIINPQVPNSTGTALVPYGGTLTMFNELDKLASNIGVARLFAGVHWRSDHDHAVRLGELYALRALQDWARLYPEDGFAGFEVRTLSGNTVTVTATAPALPNAVSAVNEFVLYNADTNQPVPSANPLRNGQVIRLAELGLTRINIRANTYPATVGSVRFVFDGTASTDNASVYDLHGTAPVPTTGTHVLTATPYSEASAAGLGGVPLTLRFNIQP
ncbi:vanadium-dependent haloperoxidase [Pyxidicoccus trucidator]|uniref:vanadium-dependent haloperoxidase n=1 Tax=Pyxidicoccus trucidator TaxID=2709662 RepID=UPI0013D920E3|nr:vanadium-dependent haloperoxidase [Pyxidicoccus trucidator]